MNTNSFIVAIIATKLATIIATFAIIATCRYNSYFLFYSKTKK